MAWLPTVRNFEDIFIRFDRMCERDRHTDGWTDGQTPHDDVGRACIASRGKNFLSKGGVVWVT